MSAAHRWKRVVSYYARPASFSTGGVNTSRQQWMAALADSGIETVLLSAHNGFTTRLSGADRLSSVEVPHLGRRRMTMIPFKLGRVLREGDLVYLHEGWTPSNAVAAWVCRRLRIDYVVLGHGVYDAAITSHLKFLTLRRLLERPVLERALAVHLFFESESADVRSIAPAARIISSVTGYDLPAQTWSPSFEDRYLAWLGRYDIRHKGIDELLEAMTLIAPSARPMLRMRGPDHLGDKARVADLVAAKNLTDWVDVGPELDSSKAREFLAASSGFIHVPRWEAFGRTIVEALSLGCPVVLASAAQISKELQRDRAALIIDGSDPRAIADGLLQLWAGAVTTGPRGRAWVAERLDWNSCAADLLHQLDDAALESSHHRSARAAARTVRDAT